MSGLSSDEIIDSELAWLLANLPPTPSFDFAGLPALRVRALQELVATGLAECIFDVVFNAPRWFGVVKRYHRYDFIGTGLDYQDSAVALAFRMAGVNADNCSIPPHIGGNVFKFGLTDKGQIVAAKVCSVGLSLIRDMRRSFPRIGPQVYMVHRQGDATQSVTPEAAPVAVAQAAAIASVGDIHVHVPTPDLSPLVEAIRNRAEQSTPQTNPIPAGHFAVPLTSLDNTDLRILQVLNANGAMTQDELAGRVANANVGKDRTFSERLTRLAKFGLIQSTTGRNARTSITDGGRNALQTHDLK